MPIFDMPKLTFGPSKVDRSLKDYLIYTESPPQTPRSVRPALPIDVEAALRSVCTQIFFESNPANVTDTRTEIRQERASLAALNYGLNHAVSEAARFGQLSSNAHAGPSYDSQHYLDRAVGSHSAQRVERLMVNQHDGDDLAARIKPLSRKRSHSTSQAPLTAVIPKTHHRRVTTGPRADSIDTTHSASQSDATEDALGPSTAITSTAVTPARGSKRTSSQALTYELLHKADAFDGDLVRQKIDTRHRLHNQQYSSTTSTTTVRPSPIDRLARWEFQDTEISPMETLLSASRQVQQTSLPAWERHKSCMPAAGATVQTQSSECQVLEAVRRPRAATLGDEAPGDDARQGRTTFRSRASHRARSLSRGVKEYIRSKRDRSRVREADRQPDVNSKPMPGLDQPATTSGARKQSLDLIRRARRVSGDALNFVYQRNHSFDGGSSAQRQKHQNPLGSHPVASRSVDRLHERRPVIDLNRALPPLPALNSWRDQDAPEPSSYCTTSELTYTPTQINQDILIRAADHNEAHLDDQIFLRARDSDSMQPIDAPSPMLKMSATAFPGDFEYYEPMRTPSVASAASPATKSQDNFRSKPSIRSLAVSSLADEDEMDDDVQVVSSPKLARVLIRPSVSDLRAQLIDTSRRPSIPTRPVSSISSKDSGDLNEVVPAMPTIQQTFRELQKYEIGETRAHTHSSKMSMTGLASQADGKSTTAYNPVALLRRTKKQWWKPGKNRKQDWMADVEQSGNKSGMLLYDDTAAAPIIKYS